MRFNLLCILFLSLMLFHSCTNSDEKKDAYAFEVLKSEQTGLDFVNRLTPTASFNMFRYMYFYNGAGLGAGDFNNDGLTDLFFSSNQEDNKLYLNKGNLRFTDATAAANIPQDHGWSTGVSVVDINSDGLLDIYVCKVGNFEVLKGKNQLLVCTGINAQGIPSYKDSAAAYGLDFSGFSTQAAFLDYDVDGDLDMFLLNHSVHQNGTFAERKVFLGTYHPYSGDRLFRNDGSKFIDVTRESTINSSAISYGLGIAAGDINMDGYPDLYIGNDFHENDYLYINRGNGTFSEELNASTMHTSQFSMGVDIGDVDNDALPEIISVDMLPEDPYILKRSLGEDEYNTFNMKLRYGYNHQYARNNLQYNRGNGLFSELGMYSGVFASDWSWGPLFTDFDNDGLKDLFISNGIPKRLNDIDYVNHVSNDEVQQKIRANTIEDKDMALINKFPEIKLRNKFYRNAGNLQFHDMGASIKNDVATFSNGAVYADFDNDGDLDIVVNNIAEPALVYRNDASSDSANRYLQLDLKGSAGNIDAIGAKAIVFTPAGTRTYEKFPVRGFQSSMEIPLHIGLKGQTPDSILLIWPDNTYQRIAGSATGKIEVVYKAGLPTFDYKTFMEAKKRTGIAVKDITAGAGLSFQHIENPFVEFDREPLIPFMVSREGPALAVADIDHNGLEDVFVGSSKDGKPAVFLQQAGGRFVQSVQPELEQDSTNEEVDACWADVNNDSHPDLVIASGGNEYYGGSDYQQPRVFLNDGKGRLQRKRDAFDNILLTASCVRPMDFTGDGFIDLFIGGRAIPFEYGEIPRSYLLANDGTGKFRDVTENYAPGLSKAGLVRNACWTDLNNDKVNDLVLSLEWDGIIAFVSSGGKYQRKIVTDKKGLWCFTLPVDIDKDGDIDLIAGNLGLNSRLKASAETPLRLYTNDFDGNGRKEQVLTYYLGGKEIPFANKGELERQLPFLKKKFLYAEDFAKANLQDLFGSEKLKNARQLTADYLQNALLINQGNMQFEVQALPWKAQLTEYRDAVVTDIDKDGLPDIFLAGNFYDNNIQMGRYDADYGTVLMNKGNGRLVPQSLNGFAIRSQVRRMRSIMVNGKETVLLGNNNDTLRLIQFEK